MKYLRIPKDTRTQHIALPRYLQGGGDRAVLVLHGFNGVTENLDPLIERLHGEGYTVHAPRLPGHGTLAKDFLLTGWRDWLRRAVDSYEDLCAAHGTVYVAGLSMGGMLALSLAAIFEVERLALLAPAVKVRNRLLPLAPLLQYLVPRIPLRYEEQSDDPQRQFLAKQYWTEHQSRTVAQFYRLQRLTRKLLPKVEAPTLTIVSAADETVPPEAADIIERRICSAETRRVVLEESQHVMTMGTERERVVQEVADWFARS